MGSRGPRPTPAAIHAMRGNPSKLPQSDLRDGGTVPAGIPPRPDWLLREAAAEWDRVSPLLQRAGLVSELDLGALAGYCQAYGVMTVKGRELKALGDAAYTQATPNGMRVMSVTLQVYNRAVDQMKTFLSEFGLSPSARAKLHLAVAQQAALFDDDPMEALLQAGASMEHVTKQ